MQKIFSIDSRNRVQGTTSNFTVDVQMPFNNNFNRCAILEAEIPKSFYQLDSSTVNTIEMTEFASGGFTGTITITPGIFYTTSSLGIELRTQLNGAGGNYNDYVVEFDSTTGRYTISSPTGPFFLANYGTLVQKYFGFGDGSAQAGGGTYVSENVVNLQRADVLYIRTNFALNNNDNVIAEIYTNNYPNLGVIPFQTQDTRYSSVTMNNNNTNQFQFSIQDNDGAVIDLNGVDCRFKVVCWECPCP